MRVFLMDQKLNVSEAYLRPGFAFGGSCLPKDVRALVHAAHAADLSLPLLSSILPSNEAQIRRGVEAVLETRRRRVGVVGLAFKPGTDDLRESPMVTLVETLIGKGCDVRILDRSVSIARLVGANRRYIEEEIPHIASLMCDDVEALLAHAEVLVDRQPRARRRRASSSRAARPGRDRPDAGRRARPARRARGVVSSRRHEPACPAHAEGHARRARDGPALPRGGRRARAAARGGRGAGRRAVGTGHRGARGRRPAGRARPRRAGRRHRARGGRHVYRAIHAAAQVGRGVDRHPHRGARGGAAARGPSRRRPRTRASCRSSSRRRDP